MLFRHDLFISYSHIDNRPLVANEEGWVTLFHHSLGNALSMTIGKEAKIWRDLKLGKGDIIDNRIAAELPRSALLLSVVSPRYVGSDSCIKELKSFCDAAANQPFGLVIDDRPRVIKVVKTPLLTDQQMPTIMQTVLGHEFYQLDESETPIVLDPSYGPEWRLKYIFRIYRLASELSTILKDLTSTDQDRDTAVVKAELRPTVYLAECSYDQRDVRESLEAELRSYGYKVLPEGQLSRDEDAFQTQVEELLKQSQLSIHLVGESYGAVPDGPSQKSIVVLQNELATKLSRERGLRRIIWMPENTVSKQAEHNAFIHDVETDPDTQFGADVITSKNPEVIKGAIHSALEKLRQSITPRPSIDETQERKLIYLICVAQDRKDTLPLRQHLKAHGYEVELPIFEGSAEEIRTAHQLLLQQSVGVLVYYGAGSPAWKLSIGNELRKLGGIGNRKTKLPIYTYLASPETESKRDLLDLNDPHSLDGMHGLTDPLSPFLQMLGREGE